MDWEMEGSTGTGETAWEKTAAGTETAWEKMAVGMVIRLGHHTHV
jgi:hypothetical protein